MRGTRRRRSTRAAGRTRCRRRGPWPSAGPPRGCGPCGCAARPRPSTGTTGGPAARPARTSAAGGRRGPAGPRPARPARRARSAPARWRWGGRGDASVAPLGHRGVAGGRVRRRSDGASSSASATRSAPAVGLRTVQVSSAGPAEGDHREVALDAEPGGRREGHVDERPRAPAPGWPTSRAPARPVGARSSHAATRRRQHGGGAAGGDRSARGHRRHRAPGPWPGRRRARRRR